MEIKYLKSMSKNMTIGEDTHRGLSENEILELEKKIEQW